MPPPAQFSEDLFQELNFTLENGHLTLSNVLMRPVQCHLPCFQGMKNGLYSQLDERWGSGHMQQIFELG